MCLDSFFEIIKGNNLISNPSTFHSVGAAYINDHSKNELAHILLLGEHITNKDQRMHVYIQYYLYHELIYLSTLVQYYYLPWMSKDLNKLILSWMQIAILSKQRWCDYFSTRENTIDYNYDTAWLYKTIFTS